MMLVEITSLDVKDVLIDEVTQELYKLVIITEHGNIEIPLTKSGLEKLKSAIIEGVIR